MINKYTNLCAEILEDMKKIKSNYGAQAIECYNNNNQIYYRFKYTQDGPFQIIPAMKFINKFSYNDIETSCPEVMI